MTDTIAQQADLDIHVNLACCTNGLQVLGAFHQAFELPEDELTMSGIIESICNLYNNTSIDYNARGHSIIIRFTSSLNPSACKQLSHICNELKAKTNVNIQGWPPPRALDTMNSDRAGGPV